MRGVHKTANVGQSTYIGIEVHGHIEIMSRALPNGIGQGRAITYNEDTTVRKDTGWHNTGVRALSEA